MSVRKRPDTGRWEARWRENGRNRSRSFRLKTDADAFELEVERRKRLGTLASFSAGEQTLAALVERYWEDYAIPRLSPKTREVYRAVWGKHAYPVLGGYRLRDLTPGRIDGFRAELERNGVGAATIVKTLTMLQSVFRRAVAWDLVVTNPVAAISKPRQPRARHVRPLAPVEVEALRRELPMRSATLVSVLAYAGVRPGEALALRWTDIGIRSIHVRSAIALGSEKETKTRRSRSVRLLDPLRRDLDALRRSVEPDERALIFAKRNGEPWADHDWRNWRQRIFRPAAEAAGLGTPRPYDLRHSFVSLLIHEGTNPIEVARQAGHSAHTCLTQYAHVFEDFDPADREPAESLIEAARTQADVRVTYAEAA